MKHVLPHENPWERLAWIVPLGLIISVLGLWGLGIYLKAPLPQSLELKPIDAQIVEMPQSDVFQTHPPEQPKTPPTSQPPQPKPELPSEPISPPTRQTDATPEPEIHETPAATSPIRDAPVVPKPPIEPSKPLPQGGEGARAIFKPVPIIPDDLRQDALSTVAVARFHVASDGTSAVELIVPTPNPKLNRILLDSLKTWRFFPAIKNGVPVSSLQDVRIPVEVR